MVLESSRRPAAAPAGYLPRPGDVILLTGDASVQFDAGRAITFRVIRVDDRPTYRGWAWLTGYQLDRRGAAVGKRDVFVQVAGIRKADQVR